MTTAFIPVFFSVDNPPSNISKYPSHFRSSISFSSLNEASGIVKVGSGKKGWTASFGLEKTRKVFGVQFADSRVVIASGSLYLTKRFAILKQREDVSNSFSRNGLMHNGG